MIKIQVGSKAFFSNYEDFEPKDNDYVQFHDDETTDFWVTNENNEHIFHFRNMNNKEFVNFEYDRSKQIPLAACKFLVPELVQYLDFQIMDLLIFEDTLHNLGSKHQYIVYIYDCYIKNGDFVLTDEQRDEAYEIYKKTHKK